jgi:SAM-dependent methyltransferase
LDFGDVPLAGAFLKIHETADEKYYPLQIQFCKDCTLVQVNNAVPGEVLFRNYFYFSSAIQTLVDHFADLAKEVTDRLLNSRESLVVEIGCNDGVFLRPLHALGVNCIGVDPATNVVNSINSPEIKVMNDYFTERVGLQIGDRYGKADVIVSSYSFAHIDDMVDVMKGIKGLLKDDGIFIFEIYHLGTIIEEIQYDMMYHEHLSYYSLHALEKFFDRFQMEIFDIKRIPLRAGTIRYYVRNMGQRKEPVSTDLKTLSEYEQSKKLDSLETYLEFAENVSRTKSQLLDLLTILKKDGNTIIGYGASGRATTIMNFCGIDSRYLDYVVDDAPAKQGCCVPGTHLLIKPWSATEERQKPDYVLMFAWSFLEEVKRRRMDYLRQGGKFIIPLPEVKIISG